MKRRKASKPKSTTTSTPGAEREGAGKAEEDRSGVCHTYCQEWQQCSLAVSNGGPGSSADEYLCVGVQSTATTHVTWCRGNPHTGPKAFAAMRQDEVRTTQHHHTPSIKARQPGRRKSNQIPRGRDQHRNWARTPQGTNHRGRDAARDGGSRQQPRKGQTQRSPTTPREAHKGQRKDTRRNAGKNTSATKTPQRGARHERKRNTKPKTNRRQGKHGPNQEHANKQPNKERGTRRRTGPQEGRKKTTTTQ